MAPVAAALAPYVSSLTAYDVDLGTPGVHRGLPGTTLTFVLPVGEPLDVGWSGSPGSRERRWSTVSGLHAHPAEIHHDGHQAGVQLALTTAGARALLGMPAAELAGELVELADVVPGLRDLPERLAASAPADRERTVQAVLLRRLADLDADAPRAEVGRALARLTRGDTVQDVADDVGYSRRHLGSLVRQECGLTPREVRRLGRFEQSRAQLGRRSLAQVAYTCGYADQAHLTRDWVELAGCPPTTWLREEFHSFKTTGVPTSQAEDMSEAANIRHWQTMSFRDADAMMAWLSSIGFTEHATYRDEADPSVVVHAEWLWPGGGGVMFGSQRDDGVVRNVGGSAAYLVVDDPDGVFDRVVAAGATVVREMVDQDYGGRGGSVEDPEGNHWSFGSYQPR